MKETFENSTMIPCNDGHVMSTCNEGINTPSICNDSKCTSNTSKDTSKDTSSVQVARLDKNDWWYLVQTLESWGVFKPRAIVKKNPLAAWKCMNLCKDKQVRHKGSYFTVCFRRELALAEMRMRLGA